MRMLIFTLSACSALVLLAQDRPSFSGTWQLDPSKSELHTGKISSATWVIAEGDNSIHISESENGKSKKTELQCTTDGKICKFPGDRQDSFWFNGPMLVDMETKSEHVTQFRIKISEDGKMLTVEVKPIVPQSDKIDTMVFQKQS